MTYISRALLTEAATAHAASNGAPVKPGAGLSSAKQLPPLSSSVPQPRQTTLSLERLIDRLPFPSELLAVLPMVAFLFISYFLGFVGSGVLFLAVITAVGTQAR